MSKKWLFLTALLISLFLFPIAIAIFLYLSKGSLRIEIPIIGRIDFSKTMKQENYQVGMNYYGPLEYNGKYYVIGKVSAEKANSSDEIGDLALIYNSDGEKFKIPSFENITFYYQVKSTHLDKLLGSVRYKIFRNIKADFINEGDWLIVEYIYEDEFLAIKPSIIKPLTITKTSFENGS